jgi:5-methyltetrahydrofolate--homocysteine methyltransferase
MRLDDGRRFTVIGENIHATRVVQRNGRRVGPGPDGRESLLFDGPDGAPRFLPIPDAIRDTQDFAAGKVKHVQAALLTAMSDDPDAAAGVGYIAWMVQRQVSAGADYLDLNVDELSTREEDRHAAMAWLVRTVGEMAHTPLSLDSSSAETIRAGIAALVPGTERAMLNSAALDRLDVLDVAAEAGCAVVVSAAGSADLPADADQRVANAMRMVEAATGRGIPLADLFIDVIVLPVAVYMDGRSGAHFLESAVRLRSELGPRCRITGGLSNVSFGMPERRLVNDVFLDLAITSGVDSGIIDPIATDPRRARAVDRESRAYRLAADALQGADPFCMAFLTAYRAGELAARPGGA